MLKRTMGMMLALLLPACTAFAAETSQPFTFRNGVTFGMTKDEVLEAEGNPEANTGDDNINGRTVTYMEIEDTTFAGLTAAAEYVFIDDSMTFCGYMLDMESDEDYDKAVEELSAEFGPAQELDGDRLDHLMEIVSGEDGYTGRMIEGGKSNCWATDAVFVVLYDNEGDQELAYFDEPAILAMETETVETETD